jgi:hypothetical protein
MVLRLKPLFHAGLLGVVAQGLRFQLRCFPWKLRVAFAYVRNSQQLPSVAL